MQDRQSEVGPKSLDGNFLISGECDNCLAMVSVHSSLGILWMSHAGYCSVFIADLHVWRFMQFWPRQLLKKWLSFQETGDDFDRDNDSNAEELSESEDFEDSDGKIFSLQRILLFPKF